MMLHVETPAARRGHLLALPGRARLADAPVTRGAVVAGSWGLGVPGSGPCASSGAGPCGGEGGGDWTGASSLAACITDWLSVVVSLLRTGFSLSSMNALITDLEQAKHRGPLWAAESHCVFMQISASGRGVASSSPLLLASLPPVSLVSPASPEYFRCLHA